MSTWGHLREVSYGDPCVVPSLVSCSEWLPSIPLRSRTRFRTLDCGSLSLVICRLIIDHVTFK
ncbi:hypothetical protein E2C01_064991 [Portunus trituberculatus]|uniref:Uncharacterized protein n=1 Tax=Portunus trituberculatus TaxID=210409 RepID=A0A5B7HMA6_PORTR|nr:hypothetical protein [Portunus trituberculatus]